MRITAKAQKILLIVMILIIFCYGYIEKNTSKKEDPNMKGYAKEILTYDDNNDIIMTVSDVICEKADYGNTLDKLTHAEKTIFYIDTIEREVNNGGFHQFFFNTDCKYTIETFEALKEIGAEYTAELLIEASKIYSIEEIDEKYRELDEKYYEYTDDIGNLEIEYIRKNVNEF